MGSGRGWGTDGGGTKEGRGSTARREYCQAFFCNVVVHGMRITNMQYTQKHTCNGEEGWVCRRGVLGEGRGGATRWGHQVRL